MKDRKKRNLIIGGLAAVLVFMAVGYAVLSQILNITGTGTISGNWDIYIDNITPTQVVGDAVSTKHEVGLDKVSAVFEANLNAPGDSVTYTVEVRNAGTIDAILDSVNLIPEKTHEYIEFTTNAVKGITLKAGNSIFFEVKVEFNPNITDYVKSDQTIRAITKLQLNFIQNMSTTPGEGGNPGTVDPDIQGESCFTISNNGTLTGYDYKCGTNVKVPAEVNGIQVKRIYSYAFKKTNIYLSYYGDGNHGDAKSKIVITDKEHYTQIERFILMTEGELNESELEGKSLADYFEVYDTIDEMIASYNGATYEIIGLNYDVETGEASETGKHQVETLDLSETVYLEAIEDYAFSDQYGYAEFGECGSQTEGYCRLGTLEEVIFPTSGSLVSIGDEAFYGNNITSINIPEGVTSIGDNAFTANKLTNLTIPSSVTTIGSFSFSYNQLQSVDISTSLNSIASGAFYGNQLTSVTIPSNVTTIESSAFKNNQLQSIIIPLTITEIGENAFQNNQLTSITIPSSITTINYYTFDNNQLQSIIISEGVTTIKHNAFSNNQLTNVTIPSSVTEIEYSSFKNNQLESVTINGDSTRFNSNWTNIGFPSNLMPSI